MTDDRRQTTDERRQTTDDRRQMTDDRRETRDEAIIFLNRPGQNEKNPRTSEEAVQYVSNLPQGELITYYPAEFKITRENRYVQKICMILVSVVCRPAGHKISNVTDYYLLLQTSGDLSKDYSVRVCINKIYTQLFTLMCLASCHVFFSAQQSTPPPPP